MKSLMHSFLYLHSVPTDGNLYGRLPSLPAEHLRCHPLPALDLGGGNCWGAAVPLHCLCMLLLCKYLPVSVVTGKTHNSSIRNYSTCTKGTLSLCRQCWRQYQWVQSPQMELYQVVLFMLLPICRLNNCVWNCSAKETPPWASLEPFFNGFVSWWLPNSFCRNIATPLFCWRFS